MVASLGICRLWCLPAAVGTAALVIARPDVCRRRLWCQACGRSCVVPVPAGPVRRPRCPRVASLRRGLSAIGASPNGPSLPDQYGFGRRTVSGCPGLPGLAGLTESGSARGVWPGRVEFAVPDSGQSDPTGHSRTGPQSKPPPQSAPPAAIAAHRNRICPSTHREPTQTKAAPLVGVTPPILQFSRSWAGRRADKRGLVDNLGIPRQRQRFRSSALGDPPVVQSS